MAATRHRAPPLRHGRHAWLYRPVSGSEYAAFFAQRLPEQRQSLLRSPSRLPREIRHASAHFNLSDPSAVNVFDAAQRLYRHGRSESLLNRVFNLTPWRTVRFLPEGNPVQAERFALTFLTLDYQLRINRCRQISEIE